MVSNLYWGKREEEGVRVREDIGRRVEGGENVRATRGAGNWNQSKIWRSLFINCHKKAHKLVVSCPAAISFDLFH